MRNILVVPNPVNYLNIELYFAGHLNSNNIVPDMGRFVSLKQSATEELSVEFDKPIQMTIPKHVTDFKMVVTDPPQDVNTPMEEGEIQQTPPRAETAASISLLLSMGHTEVTILMYE